MSGSRPLAFSEDGVELGVESFGLSTLSRHALGLSEPLDTQSSRWLDLRFTITQNYCKDQGKDLRRRRSRHQRFGVYLAPSDRVQCALNHVDTVHKPACTYTRAKISSTNSGCICVVPVPASPQLVQGPYIRYGILAPRRRGIRNGIACQNLEYDKVLSRNRNERGRRLVALLIRGSKRSNTPRRQPVTCIEERLAPALLAADQVCVSDIHHCESMNSFVSVRNVLQPRAIVMGVVVENMATISTGAKMERLSRNCFMVRSSAV